MTDKVEHTQTGARARRGPKRSEEIREKALVMRLDGLTYARIGKALGISNQRVQQLIKPPADVKQALMERAAGRCERCGIDVMASGAAHIHHCSLNCSAGDYNQGDNLEVLCPSCHRRAHVGDPRSKPERPDNGTSSQGNAELHLRLSPSMAQELWDTVTRERMTMKAAVTAAIVEWLARHEGRARRVAGQGEGE